MAKYLSLREANIARQLEWGVNDANPYPVANRSNEMMGEVGEAAAVIMLMMHTAPGPEETLAQTNELIAETADIVVTLDLVANHYGLPLAWNWGMYEPTPADYGLDESILIITAMVGQVANMVKKLERERLGFAGSRVTMDEVLTKMQDAANALTGFLGDISSEPWLDVMTKFNHTSQQVGLTTMLVPFSDIN